jgi:glycosyltransferase involved in cell wall biosynthesis
LKIAVISNRFYPTVGGAEINTLGILKELAKKHDITVLTPFRVRSKKEEVLQGIKIKRFWNIFNPFSSFPYIRGIAFCPGIVKELLDVNYDLIHIYPMADIIHVPYFLSKLFHKPLILTVYDLRGYSLTNPPSSLTYDQVHFLNKWTLKHFDFIFSISHYESAIINKINRNSLYVPCGVDLEPFDRIKNSNFRKKFKINSQYIVLSVSRIEEYKGQHIIIEAIPDIIKQEPDVSFIFAGPVFNHQYYAKLRSLVKKMNLEKYVLFTGLLSSEDLQSAYHDCDLHILPVHFINFPDTVIEAWAAKKPVIISNRVDPPWIVEDGKDGFYFDINNKQALVEKTIMLLQNKNLRCEMGNAGRKKVEDLKFTFKTIAANVEAVYNVVRRENRT